MSITVRRDGGSIDEVVAKDVEVRLEQMDDDAWHLVLWDDHTGRGVDISLFTKGHIRPRIEAVEQ